MVRGGLTQVLSILVTVGVVVMAVFGGIAVMLWRQQERIVFQPPPPPHPTVQRARRIDFQAADGQPLLAWLVGEVASTDGLVIVFHGNADLAAWQAPWADEVARRTGRAVLLAEFRGYGGLSGEPTYAGSSLDARAVYAVARDSLGVAPEQIALLGHSLGSAIAAELAREYPPEVLVLVSPLTSIRDMARRLSPAATFLYWVRAVRVHYDTEAIVRSLEAPVWVAHGVDDEVIPVAMGRRVHEAARRKGELLIIEGAGHNDVVEQGDERYWTWLTAALGSR